MKLAATALAFLALAAPAAAKPGDLDRTFATRGSTAFAGGAGYTWASDVAVRADGSVLVAGNGQSKIGDQWFTGSLLARLTTRGRVASRSFLIAPQTGPWYSDSAHQRLVLLPDGGALVGATLDAGSEHPRVGVFRVRPDGTPDPAFGSAGVTTVGQDVFLAGMGVDGAGRIVLAATSWKGGSSFVTRLLPNGALDAGYGLVPLPDDAGALLVLHDGSAFVATARHGGRFRRRAASVYVRGLDAAGRIRGPRRLTLHDRSGYQAGVTALIAGPRGSLLVAGFDARRHMYGWITRLRPDLAVDRRFGRRTIVSKHRDVLLRDMVRDRRGRIVLAGSRSLFDVPQTLVARLLPSGRRDRRFGPDGTVLLRLGSRAGTRLIASEARAVAIDARGRIVIAGAAYDDYAMDREDLGRSYFAAARLHG